MMPVLTAIIAALLARTLRPSHAELPAPRAAILEGSCWDGSGDPLGGGNALVLPATLSFGGTNLGALCIILPWPALLLGLPAADEDAAGSAPLPFRRSRAATLARREAAQTARGRENSSLQGRRRTTRRQIDAKGPPAVICVAPHALALELQARLADARVLLAGDLEAAGDLLTQGTTVSLLLVWVGRDDNSLIENLARLRESHGIPHRAVFVILEEPVRALVVQCGRFGLLNVLPGAAPPDHLVRRIRGMSAQGRTPTPPSRRRDA
jgi:hypothetical protein